MDTNDIYIGASSPGTPRSSSRSRRGSKVGTRPGSKNKKSGPSSKQVSEVGKATFIKNDRRKSVFPIKLPQIDVNADTKAPPVQENKPPIVPPKKKKKKGILDSGSSSSEESENSMSLLKKRRLRME